MSYAETQKQAQRRVRIKRELRRLKCMNFKNDDSTKNLKNYLKKCRKGGE